MHAIESYLEYSPYIVMSIAMVEFLVTLALGRKQRDRKETLANLGIWALNRPLNWLLTGTVLVTVLTQVAKWTPLKLPFSWWTALLTFLVADLLYYWNHRLSHEIRLFWTYHSVHHSSKEYNLSTAIRLPWIGILGDLMFYVPLVLLGMDPVLLAISKYLVLLYQYWIHVESVGQLGWFDRYFNSPSNHRVHHAANASYLDKNHGGILMIWDRIFGTYQAEMTNEPVRFGLTKPLNSYNPFVINFYETYLLIRDMRHARNFSEAIKFAVKGPAWRPDSVEQQLISDRAVLESLAN